MNTADLSKLMRRPSAGFRIATAILAILFGFIYSYTPMMVDDFWFRSGNGGDGFGWGPFVRNIQFYSERLFYTDPFRFAEIISLPFLSLWPGWVFDIVAAFVVWGLMLSWPRVAGVREGSLSSWVAVALLALCLPWYDYFFSIVFATNYTFALLMTALSLLCLLKPVDWLRGWKVPAACMLFFFTGWIHEGFGVPLAGAALLLTILRWRNDRLDKGYLTAVSFLCLGALMPFLGPTMWRRAEGSWAPASYPMKEFVMQWGPWVAMTLLALIVAVPALCSPRRRKKAVPDAEARERWILMSGFASFSIPIIVLFYNAPRIATGLIAADIALILMALPAYTGGRVGGISRKRIATAAKVAIFLFLFLHLGYTAVKQKQIEREHDDVVRLFLSSEDGQVFYDLSYPVPDFTMFKTSVRELHERISLIDLAKFYSRPGEEKMLTILPACLRGMDASDLEPSRSRRGGYIYRGIILADPELEVGGKQIRVRSADGEWLDTRFRLSRFRDVRGKEWQLIVPHIQTLNPGMEIIDWKI